MKTNVVEVLELIEKRLGEDCFWKKYKKALPLIYAENFALFECLSQNNHFVLIIPTNSDINIELISGIHFYIKEKNYLYIQSSRLMRDMETNRIPYFDSNGTFHKSEQIKPIVEQTYTKATQLLVKYLLLGSGEYKSTRQIAGFLNISNTSIKRAYDFLESIDAVERTGLNTSNVAYRMKSKRHFFDCVKKYFILPYRYSFKSFTDFYKKGSFTDSLYHGAEYVLSKYSDLDQSETIEYATNHRIFDLISRVTFLEKPTNDTLVTYEEWIYKIDFFSDNGEIDLVDAYIVLSKRYKKSTDTRVISAIKELERQILEHENKSSTHRKTPLVPTR